MLRMTRWPLVALALGMGSPNLSAACTVSAGARPIQCAEAVALTVTVDGAALPDSGAAERLENQLLAAAIRRLGENRIAIDPQGQPLDLEIRERSGEGVRIAVSSGGALTDDPSPEVEPLEDRSDALIEIIPAWFEASPNDLELVALDLLDRAISGNRSYGCDPVRTLSAGGRYAFELPPSHPEARARYFSALGEVLALDPSNPWPIGSLLALSGEGEEDRLSTFRLAEEAAPESFLVTDDGRYVVGFDLRQPQRSNLREGNTFIYRADGSVVRRLTLGDLLTPGDIEASLRNIWSSTGSISPLRAALDDHRDRLILTLRDSGRDHEIAVDLETGQVLTPRRDRLAQMRVTSGPYLATGNLEPTWVDPICATDGDGADAIAQIHALDLVQVPAGPFFAQAEERPSPEYPTIAKRARLQATVEVEVVVAETGRVACARVRRVPMGVDKAALAAVLRWRFRPFVVAREPVRALGRFSFRFGVTEPPEPQ